MKMIVAAVLAFVAAAHAASLELTPRAEPVPITKYYFDLQPAGSYGFEYQSGDGSIRKETGEIKSVVDAENKPKEVLWVRGEYSYTRDDGTQETVQYEGDELGYRAVGPSIPQAPAVSRT